MTPGKGVIFAGSFFPRQTALKPAKCDLGDGIIYKTVTTFFSGARIWCLLGPGRETGYRFRQHPFVLYLCLVFDPWVTHYCLPRAGLHYEYAEAPSPEQQLCA